MTPNGERVRNGELGRNSEVALDAVDWASIHHTIEQEVGVVLFTVLRFTEGGAVMERIYSSHADEYPVGGTKQVATQVSPDWVAACRDSGEPFLGATPADLDRIFDDASTIKALGCGSILNVPIPGPDGAPLATVNMCAPEGTYTPTAQERAVQIIDTGVESAKQQGASA
ncbi:MULTISPECIES: GAF domain-containing protein [unclassified Pseudoclavibacter]|uniref:GAF domain-containing protein n=1 Tax=unclassified Pseudoclavibacter TaxID=2615177 RepID=UPI0012F2902D|nr:MULTISPECIES: GAF domain-containing protein [unclassified Pseudoclavibacter]MBF4460470.1 GAF domain-containing protein [Pseudoclavibacter sp. VKM Ac-2867]VXC25002.1 conserved hypothetical protein [Pseudoclavibacter sp. 8L]